MKTILLYGDSNTYGQMAYDGHTSRYPYDKQWPNILQSLLGQDYRIIQNGLSGRTAGDSARKTYWNGKIGFEIALHSSSPVDVVIICLGSNDIQNYYAPLDATKIFEELSWYQKYVADFALETESLPIPVHYMVIPNFRQSELYSADESIRTSINAKLKDKLSYIDSGIRDLAEDGVHFSINDHEQVAISIHTFLKELVV